MSISDLLFIILLCVAVGGILLNAFFAIVLIRAVTLDAIYHMKKKHENKNKENESNV